MSPRPSPQNQSELWRKQQRVEISALSHGWHTLPNSFSAQVSFSFKNLWEERDQVIYSMSILFCEGEKINYTNMIFSRKNALLLGLVLNFLLCIHIY